MNNKFIWKHFKYPKIESFNTTVPFGQFNITKTIYEENYSILFNGAYLHVKFTDAEEAKKYCEEQYNQGKFEYLLMKG